MNPILSARLRMASLLATILGTSLLGACTTTSREDAVDPYVLYRELMPRSILVLPPINESVDVNAPYSWLTTASRPIAEQGYYVFPVAIVDEFMKENGLPNPEDMHAAPLDKLEEVFGADAVLYVTLEEFGQKFELLDSVTRINARIELVDIKTGQSIWAGRLDHSEGANSGNQQLGLLGSVINAAIAQVGQSYSDNTHFAAQEGNTRLFRNGLLKGPLHPEFAAQMEAARLEAERLEAAELEAVRLEAAQQQAQRLEAESATGASATEAAVGDDTATAE